MSALSLRLPKSLHEQLREVKAYKAGKKVLRVHVLKEPAPPKIIRAKLKLSPSGHRQSEFCDTKGGLIR
ncbi:MAG: hypothetical protein IT314_14080 [Anaerolineales bacterium]|nr:hypothetical protein [Anaerolineales bacterium]